MRLHEDEIYIYKKGELVPYNVFKFEYKGYTIQNLYEINQKNKQKKKELEEYLKGKIILEEGKEYLICIDGKVVKGKINAVKEYNGENEILYTCEGNKIIKDKKKEGAL